MIKIDGVVKRFGNFTALNNISCEIQNGSIYGLVGINGAGKSTLLRVITGIYESDSGTVSYDGVDLKNDPAIKGRIAFVADELFLPNGSSMLSLAKKFELLYGHFNYSKFQRLACEFCLDVKKSVNTFSKGMRRQASTILALSLETDYIFFDETFDGLDPFKRSYIKKLLSEEVNERNSTVIITSHSLKELEDICDKLAVVDKGGLVFESEASEKSVGGVRVQVAFSEDYGQSKFSELDVIDFNKRGSVAVMTVRGEEKDVREKLEKMSPILLEILPLSFEDVFSIELSKKNSHSAEEKADAPSSYDGSDDTTKGIEEEEV